MTTVVMGGAEIDPFLIGIITIRSLKMNMLNDCAALHETEASPGVEGKE